MTDAWDDCIFTYMKTIKKNQPFMEVNIQYMDPMGMDFF